ncbi:DJ-1/PfpI family protein [Kineosporia sp. J2-2]|uniref:DJ-1/PfpI family protein n=1 Tax=Kineosporia corallincola TaxID=2835133 RepID=A0ABS5TL27_9ACTN|nr:DJ-1/PfpI family protein [Kineosporia corallincola]MBT0771715.1 DJ-1/PfpI family protein [Kineosporia corallincola]
MTDSKVIGIVLFDGVEELDAVGPWEVLAQWTRNHPEDGYRVITLAPTADPVTCAKRMRIVPDQTFADAGPLDVVLHPGGHGTRRLMRDRAHLERVRGWAARADLMTSVCTGSLVYAAAGLLRGRPATTHRNSLDLLAETDPTILVDEKSRFVDDVTVITGAGVSAGIDMALHLVSRLSFPDRAVGVRHSIQYDPEPPV